MAVVSKTGIIVNPKVLENGIALAKSLLEGGSSGWSTLVGKDVTCTIDETDYGLPEEVIRQTDRTSKVVTPVEWDGDRPGQVFLVVSPEGAKTVVAYMTALMFGGDANPATTELDADGMDAYSEAVNSFFGQGVQHARGDIGGVIKTSVGATSVVDLSATTPDAAFGGKDLVCFRVSAVVEGQPPFDLLLLMTRSVTGVLPESGNTLIFAKQAAASAKQLGVSPDNLAAAMQIKIPIIVNIATKKMRMELIQDMNPGTIIEFRKMSGEPLDVLAGNVKIAEAEVVISNQCFGIQIRAIVDPRAVVLK